MKRCMYMNSDCYTCPDRDICQTDTKKEKMLRDFIENE